MKFFTEVLYRNFLSFLPTKPNDKLPLVFRKGSRVGAFYRQLEQRLKCFV